MGLDRGKMRKPWEVWERVLAENKRNGQRFFQQEEERPKVAHVLKTINHGTTLIQI